MVFVKTQGIKKTLSSYPLQHNCSHRMDRTIFGRESLWEIVDEPKATIKNKKRHGLFDRIPISRWTLYTIPSPLELKICDPVCGTGHILTYVFDLVLSDREEGFPHSEIPTHILQNNIYGIEIDPAGICQFCFDDESKSQMHLFFKTQVIPNICILENVTFEDEEISTFKNMFDFEYFSSILLPNTIFWKHSKIWFVGTASSVIFRCHPMYHTKFSTQRQMTFLWSKPKNITSIHVCITKISSSCRQSTIYGFKDNESNAITVCKKTVSK